MLFLTVIVLIFAVFLDANVLGVLIVVNLVVVVVIVVGFVVIVVVGVVVVTVVDVVEVVVNSLQIGMYFMPSIDLSLNQPLPTF